MEGDLVEIKVFAVAKICPVEDMKSTDYIPNNSNKNEEQMVPVDVILLKSKDSLYLPIFIGLNEASAIYWYFDNTKLKQPTIYDFMINLLKGAKSSVNRVVIHKIENEIFFAFIELRQNSSSHDSKSLVKSKSRAIDAINFAIRVDAPIFVTQEIMDQYSHNSSTFEVCCIKKEGKKNNFLVSQN